MKRRQCAWLSIKVDSGGWVNSTHPSISELVQSVERRDLVGFGERRVIEHGVSEVLDSGAGVHNRLSYMDQFRRSFADDVESEQLQIPGVKQEFQLPGLVTENLASRQFIIFSDPDLIRNLLLSQLPLGLPDHRDFRNSVDAVRKRKRRVV